MFTTLIAWMGFPLSSTLVIRTLGDDDERLNAIEPCLRLKRSPPPAGLEPVGLLVVLVLWPFDTFSIYIGPPS